MEQNKKSRRKVTATGDDASAGKYDVDVLTRLDRVTAPKQARSERSLQRILEVLETLLESRTFAEISIPDIAAGANCGVAAIYARFRDKNSILAALHESLRERMMLNVQEILSPKRTAALSVDACIRQFCTDLARAYATQRNLLAASLMLGDQDVYERAAFTIRHCSTLLAAALRAASDVPLGEDFDSRVHTATGAVFALVQQRTLFHPACPAIRARNTDRHFVGELVRLVHLCIDGKA